MTPVKAAMGKPAPDGRRARTWRTTLIGALIGILIVQVMLMMWLAEAQVEAGLERQSLEAAARKAQARCFESATHRGKDACRAGLASAGAER